MKFIIMISFLGIAACSSENDIYGIQSQMAYCIKLKPSLESIPKEAYTARIQKDIEACNKLHWGVAEKK